MGSWGKAYPLTRLLRILALSFTILSAHKIIGSGTTHMVTWNQVLAMSPAVWKYKGLKCIGFGH